MLSSVCVYQCPHEISQDNWYLSCFLEDIFIDFMLFALILKTFTMKYVVLNFSGRHVGMTSVF